MRTMAQAEADARRYNENYDYYNFDAPLKQEIEVDDSYKITWPEGYWSEYDVLKQEALKASDALSVSMVMGFSGRYRVYALMSSGAMKAGPRWGPEASDRLGAWRAFIQDFVPKLKPKTRPMKLAVNREDKTLLDEFGKKHGDTFDKKITDPNITVRTPKKSKR